MAPDLPGRRLAGLAARRAQRALAPPARWVVLSGLDTALSAADSVVTSSLAREVVARVVASPLADDVLQRLVEQTLSSPETERLVIQTVDRAEVDQLVERVLDGPFLEAAVARVIDSRLTEAAVTQVFGGPLFDVIVERLLESNGLWVLIDEIAGSPAVTAAISQQGVSFANQVAGVARERSRTADDRLERLAARLTRRVGRSAAGPTPEPASGS
jgi:hypothetical protein